MPDTKPATIYELFARVKREVGPVGKDSKNEQQHFNFRGIDAVVNAAAPALDKHGVITVPILSDIEYATVEVGQRRTPMAHVRVKVTYRFYGPAGDHFETLVPGEAMDSGDKATAKAMSVAYRIALLQGLNLPTNDPDPDLNTYERSPQDRPRYAHTDAAHERLVPGQSAEDRANGKKAERIKGKAPDDEWTTEVTTDQAWLDEITKEALAFTSDDYGRVLWRRVTEKAAAQGCTQADSDKLRKLLQARHKALEVERQEVPADAS